MHDTYLTRNEAAAFLGVRSVTMKYWAWSGYYKLPYLKIGRFVRYKLKDLEDFVESRTKFK
jgi:predicted site-specific integrase-resolvase